MNNILKEDWEYLFSNLNFESFNKKTSQIRQNGDYYNNQKKLSQLEEYGNKILASLSRISISHLPQNEKIAIEDSFNYCLYGDLEKRFINLSNSLDNKIDFTSATKTIWHTVHQFKNSDIQKARILAYFSQREPQFGETLKTILTTNRTYSPLDYIGISKVDLDSKRKNIPLPDFFVNESVNSFKSTLEEDGFERYRTTLFKAFSEKYNKDDVITFLKKHKTTIISNVDTIAWLKQNIDLNQDIISAESKPIANSFENVASFSSTLSLDFAENLHHHNLELSANAFLKIFNRSISLMKGTGLNIIATEFKNGCGTNIQVNYRTQYPDGEEPYYPKELFNKTKNTIVEEVNKFFDDYINISEFKELLKEVNKSNAFDFFSDNFETRMQKVYQISEALKQGEAIELAINSTGDNKNISPEKESERTIFKL